MPVSKNRRKKKRKKSRGASAASPGGGSMLSLRGSIKKAAGAVSGPQATAPASGRQKNVWSTVLTVVAVVAVLVFAYFKFFRA